MIPLLLQFLQYPVIVQLCEHLLRRFYGYSMCDHHHSLCSTVVSAVPFNC